MGVLVQSALQTLHRASAKARELNHFAGGSSHAWASYYEQRVDSDRSCLNEWHAMDSIESRRPPSPDSLRHKPRERGETERVIRCTLKEIMMTVDLDEVTSKVIRVRLEEELDMDLGEFKSFIDQEMLTILGQMDAPTEVFDHVYLGSEWNASNLEELQRNGVRHILNVTREIDNFFPGMFNYLNIRVYDDDKTDLLKHWDNTFKYITKAKKEGSKVLVHCKMGISRSASVVIAYAMKAYNWNFDEALNHVKGKRNCIKPNKNFLSQLETYQGMLDAMKNREKLQRSKSETNLKSPSIVSKTESKITEPTPLVQSCSGSCGGRPRSWSPDTKLASELLPPTSVSLEHLLEPKHMLMPCGNGSYSVSPNQIMRLKEQGVPSVRHIVNEIESVSAGDKKKAHRRSFRLNCNNQNDNAADSLQQDNTVPTKNSNDTSPLASLNQKNKIHTWDPGERDLAKCEDNKYSNENIVKCDSGMIDYNIKKLPENNLVEKFSEIDEKRSNDDAPPSRQSSCSSFDSAVVPDLSRHSSWGSYDTRTSRVQVTIRDDSGTVKKTKQKLEDISKQDGFDKALSDSVNSHKLITDLSIISENEASKRVCDNERKFNETCAILKSVACGSRGSTWAGRMAASAPNDSWFRRLIPPAHLHSSHNDLSFSLPHTPPTNPSHSSQGIVKNLKMEFEARSTVEPEDSDTLRRKKSPALNPDTKEDLSVKVLVDKYDSHLCKTKCETTCDSKSSNSKRVHDSASKKSRLLCESEVSARVGGPPFLRNSFCGVLRSGSSCEKPPVAPNVVSMAPINYPSVVMASVLSKAQTKKQLQHGKTHPLTRLNINRQSNRCSNPVYNTM